MPSKTYSYQDSGGRTRTVTVSVVEENQREETAARGRTSRGGAKKVLLDLAVTLSDPVPVPLTLYFEVTRIQTDFSNITTSEQSTVSFTFPADAVNHRFTVIKQQLYYDIQDSPYRSIEYTRVLDDQQDIPEAEQEKHRPVVMEEEVFSKTPFLFFEFPVNNPDTGEKFTGRVELFRKGHTTTTKVAEVMGGTPIAIRTRASEGSAPTNIFTPIMGSYATLEFVSHQEGEYRDLFQQEDGQVKLIYSESAGSFYLPQFEGLSVAEFYSEQDTQPDYFTSVGFVCGLALLKNIYFTAVSGTRRLTHMQIIKFCLEKLGTSLRVADMIYTYPREMDVDLNLSPLQHVESDIRVYQVRDKEMTCYEVLRELMELYRARIVQSCYVDTAGNRHAAWCIEEIMAKTVNLPYHLTKTDFTPLGKTSLQPVYTLSGNENGFQPMLYGRNRRWKQRNSYNEVVLTKNVGFIETLIKDGDFGLDAWTYSSQTERPNRGTGRFVTFLGRIETNVALRQWESMGEPTIYRGHEQYSFRNDLYSQTTANFTLLMKHGSYDWATVLDYVGNQGITLALLPTALEEAFQETGVLNTGIQSANTTIFKDAGFNYFNLRFRLRLRMEPADATALESLTGVIPAKVPVMITNTPPDGPALYLDTEKNWQTSPQIHYLSSLTYNSFFSVEINDINVTSDGELSVTVYAPIKPVYTKVVGLSPVAEALFNTDTEQGDYKNDVWLELDYIEDTYNPQNDIATQAEVFTAKASLTGPYKTSELELIHADAASQQVVSSLTVNGELTTTWERYYAPEGESDTMARLACRKFLDVYVNQTSRVLDNYEVMRNGSDLCFVSKVKRKWDETERVYICADYQYIPRSARGRPDTYIKATWVEVANYQASVDYQIVTKKQPYSRSGGGSSGAQLTTITEQKENPFQLEKYVDLRTDTALTYVPVVLHQEKLYISKEDIGALVVDVDPPTLQQVTNQGLDSDGRSVTTRPIKALSLETEYLKLDRDKLYRGTRGLMEFHVEAPSTTRAFNWRVGSATPMWMTPSGILQFQTLGQQSFQFAMLSSDNQLGALGRSSDFVIENGDLRVSPNIRNQATGGVDDYNELSNRPMDNISGSTIRFNKIPQLSTLQATTAPFNKLVTADQSGQFRFDTISGLGLLSSNELNSALGNYYTRSYINNNFLSVSKTITINGTTKFLNSNPDFTISVGSNGPSTEEIQDIVGAMVSGNSESGINVTYNDSAGKLDFDVTVSTGTSLTTEQVQDIVGAMVSGNVEQGIIVEYNDSGGKLNFSVTNSGSGGFTTEEVQDIVGAMFNHNSGFTYNDSSNRVDVSLTGGGLPPAKSFQFATSTFTMTESLTNRHSATYDLGSTGDWYISVSGMLVYVNEPSALTYRVQVLISGTVVYDTIQVGSRFPIQGSLLVGSTSSVSIAVRARSYGNSSTAFIDTTRVSAIKVDIS